MNKVFNCALISTPDNYINIMEERLKMVISSLKGNNNVKLVLVRHNYKDENKLDINDPQCDINHLYLKVTGMYSLLAQEYGIYISPGIIPEMDNKKLYKTACLFNSNGDMETAPAFSG